MFYAFSRSSGSSSCITCYVIADAIGDLIAVSDLIAVAVAGLVAIAVAVAVAELITVAKAWAR